MASENQVFYCFENMRDGADRRGRAKRDGWTGRTDADGGTDGSMQFRNAKYKKLPNRSNFRKCTPVPLETQYNICKYSNLGMPCMSIRKFLPLPSNALYILLIRIENSTALQNLVTKFSGWHLRDLRFGTWDTTDRSKSAQTDTYCHDLLAHLLTCM